MRSIAAIRDAIRRPKTRGRPRQAAQTHINYVRQRLSDAAQCEQRQQRSLRHLS
jgi:hypothetical protein